MGGLCTKPTEDDVVAPTTTGDGAKGADAHAHAGKTNSKSATVRRESERKGLRQGLVHERKHVSVWDVYEVVKEIGHGMTGKVYQVRQKTTGEVYALKCMEMRRIDPELLDDLRNEIELLKMMDHPNVIKLYEYYEDQHNIYLILEFCDGGELFDRLHEQTGSRYTEAEAARLMFKMCAAIGYCHYMGISHRDLKLENFIFEARDAEANIKLIDFGLSAKYGSTIRRMHTMVGTAYYIAPEVLNQADGSSGGYTNACDCWSLGVIAYMMLSGTPPFKGKRDREVLQAVRKGKYTLSGPKWEHISEDSKDFIRHLLVYNPAKRMTAEQALKHPWLQRAKGESVHHPLDPEILQNLRDFSKFSTFKRAALEAIAFSMSAQSIRHLREQFMKLDKDQSGFVSLGEFLEVVSSSGLSKEEAIRIFEGIDQDRTNNISYTEFLAASLSRRLWLSRERIKDAFQRLDVDNKGYITQDNLKELLGDDWTPERVATMMKEADTKGDGRIDFDEFLAVMTKESKEGWKDVLPASANGAGLPVSISSSDLASLGAHPHERDSFRAISVESTSLSGNGSAFGDCTHIRASPDSVDGHVAPSPPVLAAYAPSVDGKDFAPTPLSTVREVSVESAQPSASSAPKLVINKSPPAQSTMPVQTVGTAPLSSPAAHAATAGVISAARSNSASTNSIGRASAALAAGLRAAMNSASGVVGNGAAPGTEPLLVSAPWKPQSPTAASPADHAVGVDDRELDMQQPHPVHNRQGLGPSVTAGGKQANLGSSPAAMTAAVPGSFTSAPPRVAVLAGGGRTTVR